MAGSRVAVVFNPTKTTRRALAAAARAALPDAALTWYETTVDDPGDGAARAAVTAGCDVVVAAGGDGTVRAVAEALAGSSTPMAIVPRGTGNLFARNIGIPLGDARAALARIADAQPRRMDVGRVAVTDPPGTPERVFVVMVGFGLDAHMLAETDEELKSRAGWLAYVEAIGRALSASALLTVAVAVDDGPEREVEAHTLMVGNCGALQAGVQLLPDAAPDDGALDMLVASSHGPLQWLDTLRSVVWDNGIMRLFDRDRKAASTGTVGHRQLRSIEVTLPEPRAFEIDGEEAGAVRAFRCRVDPGALLVY